jgi:hypothetical protein
MTGPDAGTGARRPEHGDQEQPPGTPRWVKVSMAVVATLLLLVLASLLADGGHGPARHGGG